MLLRAHNQTTFGLLLPVSGLVKHFWAAADGYSLPFGLGLPRQAPGTLGIVAMVWVAVWFATRKHAALRERFRDSGLGFLLFVASAVVAADVLTVGYIAPWYLGPAVLCSAVAAGVLACTSRLASSVAISLAVATAIARMPYTVSSVRSHRLQAHRRGEAADWLRHHTPRDARIGSWNGGMLGYYSGRHIIMLDGLANGRDFYQQAFVRGDVLGYLDGEHIDLLVTTGHGMGPLLYVERSNPLRALEAAYGVATRLTDRGDAAPHDAMVLWSRR